MPKGSALHIHIDCCMDNEWVKNHKNIIFNFLNFLNNKYSINIINLKK